jgi:hypothetical protein
MSKSVYNSINILQPAVDSKQVLKVFEVSTWLW